MADIHSIKELRDQTGISVAECQKALEEASGDKERALEILKARGAEVADKKSDRHLGAGVISSYIHGHGTLGVLVELSCETDFVAKNEGFEALAIDIAMHIAAMNPADTAELLTQEFIKDPALTIESLIQQGTQKFGERIVLPRFARFEIGV